jgi:hypothetical protein
MVLDMFLVLERTAGLSQKLAAHFHLDQTAAHIIL